MCNFVTLLMTLFSIGSHDWLLSDTVDILPHLLLPLTGPEEFPEDDMEKLPPDLQYLDENKQRESDPGIRRMLLEALLQVYSHGFSHVCCFWWCKWFVFC